MSRISWREGLQLETDIALMTVKQEEYGVYFNKGKAIYYMSLLDSLKDEQYTIVRPFLKYSIEPLESKIKGEYSYVKKIKLKNGEYTPSVTNHYDDPSIVEGPFSRIEIEEPSIGKRKLIIEQLLGLGWKPTIFTEKGFPKLTDAGEPVESLAEVGTFGKALSMWYVYSHRKSQIKGFLPYVREDGRIAAQLNSCATNTFRAAHKVVANIPRPTSVFGKEMRSLFGVREGRVLVGADASGLELRMLAHHMNDPEYTKQILEGDIHIYNQEKAGLPTRDNSKTFIYAFLYGGGNEKIGRIIGKGSTAGKAIKDKFFAEIPALSKLINRVRNFAESRGFLPSIDGRKILIRSFEGRVLVHTALNALLQANGSIVVKKWLSIVNNKIEALGLDAHQVIFYHDEAQWDCDESIVEEFEKILLESMREAGEYYKLKIRLDAEAKHGKTWGDTH